MKRFRTLLGYVLLLIALLGTGLFINKAIAQSTCSYAVCDRTDRLNPKATYKLINYDTIIGTFPNGKTAIFTAQIDDPKKQVIDFEAPQSNFCFIPGESDGRNQSGRHIRVKNPGTWPPTKTRPNTNIDIFAFEGGKCVDPAQGSATLLVGTETVTTATSTSGSGGSGGTFNTGAPCNKSQVDKGKPLLGLLPVWWEYVKEFRKDTLGQCVPVLNFPGSIYPVGLAVLDILLRIAGFVAVIAIIWAGVEFLFAQGNTEKAGGAQRRVFTSLIGLGIAFVAALVVSFLGNSLTK